MECRGTQGWIARVFNIHHSTGRSHWAPVGPGRDLRQPVQGDAVFAAAATARAVAVRGDGGDGDGSGSNVGDGPGWHCQLLQRRDDAGDGDGDGDGGDAVGR